jgi:Domain of unknown function (DUF4062)
MELFPAADDAAWEVIKRFISECDYYIVIVGGRYGSVGADGESYTEMEYDYAVKAGLPILAFLHGDPGGIPAKKTEATDDGKAALRAFRDKIEAAHHAKYWKVTEGLSGLVAISMSQLKTIRPRVGWVRGDQVADESAAQEILKLRKKIDELDAHIAQSELTPPPGTEDLAQGEETIPVHFHCEVNNSWIDTQEDFSWNTILSILGPILIIHATEATPKNKAV